MIRLLTLKNFQAHKHLEIEFDPRITTIVGPSDVGKSAIIRALSLATLNKPNGVAFVKKGKSGAVVTLEVDGRVVVRKRGQDLNFYSLDGKEFKAFGKGKVPEEIENLVNISEVNFQRQLDAPYWFTQTPGQVSRNLNQIVNLTSIDTAISKIASRVRHNRTEMEVIRGRYISAKETLEDLKWVPAIEREFNELKELEKEYEKNRISGDALAKRIRDVESLTETYEINCRAIKDAEEVIQTGLKLKKLSSVENKLAKEIAEIEKQEKLVKLEIPDISELEKIRNAGDRLEDERRELEYLIEEITENKNKLDLLESELEKYESKLKEMKVCPTCGQKINKSSLSSHLIYTSAKKPQCLGPKKPKANGLPELRPFSNKYKTLKTNTTPS